MSLTFHCSCNAKIPGSVFHFYDLRKNLAGYSATRHQREVGTGYFDLVSSVVSGGQSSTRAMAESTEAGQFVHAAE